MKLLDWISSSWKIIAAASKAIAVLGVLTGLVLTGFKYYDNTKDNDTELFEAVYKEVIPKLNYLVRADSANKARNEAMLCKIDSTRYVVDALAKKRTVEIVNDSSLTREEFLIEMKPFMEYIDEVKKNERRKDFDNSSLSKIPLDTRFPDEWVPKPNTTLIPMNRK